MWKFEREKRDLLEQPSLNRGEVRSQIITKKFDHLKTKLNKNRQKKKHHMFLHPHPHKSEPETVWPETKEKFLTWKKNW